MDKARTKASIPKLQVFNNALKTIYTPLSFEQAVVDCRAWGHIFESSVGAYIINQPFAHRFEVFYWRDRNDEVNFVLRKKGVVVAIEVKSNAEMMTAGMEKFKSMFNPRLAVIVGNGGIPAEEFMKMDLRCLL